MKTTHFILIGLLSALALVAVGCDAGDGADPGSGEGSGSMNTDPADSDPGSTTTPAGPTGTTDPSDPSVVEDPVTDPVEDPVVDPVEDPIEDPVEDPVEETVVLPELPDGPDDAYAASGCANLTAEAATVIAGATESEAGQALLLPGMNSSFFVQLPESGVGYVTVEIPDWQIVVAAFAHHTTGITILDPDEKTVPISPLSWSAACADEGVTDQRTKYHQWGGFTFVLTGEPSSEVWLSLIDYEE